MSAIALKKNNSAKRGMRVFLGVWIALVVSGFVALESYANAPGKNAMAPGKLAERASLPKLLIFIHPQCSCSRATLAELGRLISDCGPKLETVVEVYAPSSMPESWAKADLYRAACSIPGVQVKLDRDGAEALRFGVFTSGQTLLYSPEGKLLFRGGLTAMRGHEGPNLGSDSIEAYVRSGRLPAASTPVFGCALGLNVAGS